MKNKLNQIAEKAKRDKRLKFTSLIHHINEANLVRCYSELKKDKASGIDGITVEEYGCNLEENIEQLVGKLKSKKYRPQPVRRVYIPKAGSDDKRGLGIPAVEDKLVQIMLKKILEAIFETDFVDCSYGFLPGRSCTKAIIRLNEEVMHKPINFIVEVDISKFFDSVSHYWLQRCLEERIADRNLLWLVRRFLKAGVIEDGEFHASEHGTPQGGVISPLLANIYLHYVLDIWFEREFKSKAKGYMQCVRYCDDFVVVCESEYDAKEFLKSLEGRLSKFGLAVSPKKTKIIKFGRGVWNRLKKIGEKPDTFNFLGFTHYCAASRQGYFIMAHKTSKENLRRKLKEVQEWLRKIRSFASLKEWWQALKAKLIGHYNYFGISGNYRCLKQFYERVVCIAFKWINRRSQRKSMTAEMFFRYLELNPLPMPRIYHKLYVLR